MLWSSIGSWELMFHQHRHQYSPLLLLVIIKVVRAELSAEVSSSPNQTMIKTAAHFEDSRSTSFKATGSPGQQFLTIVADTSTLWWYAAPCWLEGCLFDNHMIPLRFFSLHLKIVKNVLDNEGTQVKKIWNRVVLMNFNAAKFHILHFTCAQ